MKAFLHGAPIGALGGLTGLGDGEIRLPVLTRIFWHNVKLAVPIILAVSLLTVVSATITRISITSVEGLVPIYSIVFILAVAGMVGAYVGTAYLYRLHETGLERVVTGLFLLTTSLVFPHISTSGGTIMPRKRRSVAAEEPKDVLTAREAAKYLRLALPTFYRYMWEGKVPSSKIGGRYRFKKSLLDKWLGKAPEGEAVSGRNKLVGTVSAIKRDKIMAQINLDVGEHKITAVITRDALDALGLKVGDKAVALIKATEVMVIKEG